MVLEAKNFDYQAIEITPGLGQVAIFTLSGQRQLPVLKHGEIVISDSSAIIGYLEKLKPEPKLIPKHPKEKALVQLIEDWADTTMAKATRNALIKAAAIDPDLLLGLLPNEVPTQLRNFIGELPCEIISDLSGLIHEGESTALLSNLEELSHSVQSSKWLVGNEMSIADIAIAAQLSLLRFPQSAGIKLAGKGCPGFSDNPLLEPLFDWRDQIENQLMATDFAAE